MTDVHTRRQRRRRPARRGVRERDDRRRSARCQSCGAENALGAHRAYRGAGVVLRCPACGDVAVRIGVRDDALVFEWRGTFTAPRPG